MAAVAAGKGGEGMTFRQHLKQEAYRILDTFPEELRPEIYVVALSLYRVDQDARYPYVDIGYNTESQIRRECERSRGGMDPDGEVRWSYAYWILDGFERVGHVPEDPVGTALHRAEAAAKGLWFEDEEQFSERWEAVFDALCADFAEDCVHVARHLHETGRVEEVLGRRVPVVLFDMDDPEDQIPRTAAANPPEVVADYLAWQRAQVEE
ncbi:hypothetical protein [Streptomyces sp. MAR4 CNX-425]|uniref:hypothetical protein n=1 Tax=Streptomyces sp. MAR4 CNX-425 TaxID=3406343 RepID=UPI003B5079A9